MRQIDVLWLVEHVAREMDVACAVKCLTERRYGLQMEVRHVYLHAHHAMGAYIPRLIVLPSFYSASDLATADYMRRWPDALYFNLAWEEIFYQGHLQLKAPSDDVARRKVVHNAWGEFYKRYLVGHGVESKNIVVTGNPAYQLYRRPYCQYYSDRAFLAREYGLDPAKRWVLVPENYRWAFITDQTIHWRVSQGAQREELTAMRAFAQQSLTTLLTWCNHAARCDGVEVIFRPKPATLMAEMDGFLSTQVAEPRSPRLHLIKAESVREWILASDVIVSAFSTTLIEAAIAGRPAYMVEPLPTTEAFDAEWYGYLPQLKSEAEFVAACVGGQSYHDGRLKAWAEREMLAQGDPISNLADCVYAMLSRQARPSTLSPRWQDGVRGLVTLLRARRKRFFNARTHENDRFTPAEVDRRTQAWAKILT